LQLGFRKNDALKGEAMFGELFPDSQDVLIFIFHNLPVGLRVPKSVSEAARTISSGSIRRGSIGSGEAGILRSGSNTKSPLQFWIHPTGRFQKRTSRFSAIGG
jgi:hypothetical protein